MEGVDEAMKTTSRSAGHLPLQAAGAVGVALALIVPIMVALYVGMEPYDLLIRNYPGVGISAATTAFQAVAELASVVAVGALVSVLFLRPLPGRTAFKVPDGLDRTILRWSAGTWALSTFVLVFLNALDTSGMSLAQLAQPGMADYLVASVSNFWPSVLRFAGAALVALTARVASRWTTLLIGLWGAGLSVLTPIAVGQVLVGPDHDFGGDAATVQALVGYPTLGVLLVIGLRVLFGDDVATVTWRRWLRMAVVALPVMVLAEAILTWFKLAGSPLLSTLTGWLMVWRWAALALVCAAALGIIVARRRRRFRPVEAPLLALGSLGIFGWVAITVAMLRVLPPQYFVPTSPAQVFLGYDTPDAPTLVKVLTSGRPNMLFVALGIAGIVFYLVALAALRRRGTPWPWTRTLSWILGWVVVIYVTSSGLGLYSAPHFGIHMIVHMSLSMFAPVLLSLGGVLTLLLRASRAGGPVASMHDWVSWMLQWRVAKWLYNPIVAFTLFISSYYALYFTGLFEHLMTYHWGHQLMNAHFLLVGYVYYSLIIGVDRGPKPLPHIAKLGLAMAAMPFHAFFGVILMNGRSIIAEQYYYYLGMPWADLPAAQELGGGVAWAGGEIPSLLVVVALGIQWARQDSKEAARADRHMDTGRDNEYEEYNEMLQRLAERSAAPSNRREGEK